MIATVAAVLTCLSACSTSKVSRTIDETQTLSPRVIRVGDPVPKGGGVYKLGEPYLAGGKWYTPINDTSYDKVGQASWYGDFFHGRKTANGEIYDMHALTAAHPTFAMPTYAKVTNLSNNRSIIVRVNDRGPYASDRIIDLSRRAAELLGFHNHGIANVRVQYYGPAPMNGDDSVERNMATRQSQSWSTRVENKTPSASSSASLAGKSPSTAMLASAVKTAPQPAASPAPIASASASSSSPASMPTSTFAVTEVVKTQTVRSSYSPPSTSWVTLSQGTDTASSASFSGQ